MRYRRVTRPASRSAFRRTARSATRVRWRAPDDLGLALACFRRAIRAHRRLARLAPRFFDSALLERERRDFEARCRWMDSWKPAFLKVYGTELKPLTPDPPPPLPPPHIQLAVELELTSFKLWFAAGSQALRRFRLRHPHALVDLSRLVRLMEIASDLGRLSTGCPQAEPRAKPPN